MKNQIYKKWAKQAVGCALVGLLSACNSGVVDSQTTPSTPNMVSIDAASTVPVFAGTATTSLIYVHNNSDMPIKNIKYSVEANSGSAGNQFSLNSGSCSSIAAHSSCSLGFTTPQLKEKATQGSAIITARSSEGYFKQIINYALTQNASNPGIYGSEATIHSYGNTNGYATVYLYAGGQNQSYQLQSLSSNNSGITINSPSNSNLASTQVVAIEVSTKAQASLANNQATNVKAATMQVNYTNLTTKLTGTTLVGLTVAPINNGPVLTSGAVPIIDVQTSVNGQLLVVNSGNSAATISAITPPSGVSIGSGSNACSTSTPLAAGASCTVYFSVSQAGGSSNLSITYDGGATLSQNITWYNPVGGALLQMTSSPGSVSFNSGSSSTPITVTVTNIGGYDLTGVTIPAASNTNGGNATATTSTALACQTSSGGSTGTTLQVGGLCTYAITLADTVAESNMNMSLFIAGNYTNSSGAATYQRATNISYAAINTLPPPSITSTNPIDGATGIQLNPPISITFNESVQNVSSTNIELHESTVSGTIISIGAITNSGTTYTFSPATSLSNNITYFVILKNGITNQYGTPLTPTSFSFTTISNLGKVIFVTAGLWNGDLKTAGGGVNGTQGADNLCNNDAAKPATPVGATYKAMILSQERSGSPLLNWVLTANTAYYNLSGQAIGTTNASSVFTFPVSNSINNLSTIYYVWTGAWDNPWSLDSSGQQYYCNNWTSSSSSILGDKGAANAVNTTMMNVQIDNYHCNQLSCLYCAQQ